MINIYILRVFTDQQGRFGNYVSIVVDKTKKLNTQRRLQLTQQLGHDETVFINSIANANVSIFNSRGEVKFAGHAMVGTAWLLNKRLNNTNIVIRCLGENIHTKQSGELVWIEASLAMMPPWHYKQLNNPTDVERLASQEANKMEHTLVWAWIDEAKGLIRARTFASDWGIPEAQANGSGSMTLAAQLKRELEIKHGEGSVIYVRPGELRAVSLGGRVIEEPLKQI